MTFFTYYGLKSNQVFVDWLSEPCTSSILTAINNAADVLKRGESVQFDLSVFDAVEAAPAVRKRPPTVSSSTSSIQFVSRLSDAVTPPIAQAVTDDTGASIQSFYTTAASDDEEKKIQALADLGTLPIARIEDLFETHCGLPACFAVPFIRTRALNAQTFTAYWRANIMGKSPNERLLRVLIEPPRKTIVPADITPFVHSLAVQHPSLQFLQEDHSFFGKYVEFVVTRLFYVLDPELRGSATLHQIRRMDLAGKLFEIFHMPDLNEPASLFNYQHFYVTFCRFWDLDTDGDGWLSKADVLKFNDSALTPIICDRFMNFRQAPRSFSRGSLVDFRSFIYLLISTEDKTSLTSINLWFKLCDLDDDGVLSVHEIARLYEQQYERLAVTGNETIPFPDILRQLLDVIRPANLKYFTVADLVASKQAPLFFNTLVDLQKFIQQEYQPAALEQEMDEIVKKLTPWEYFALSEYEALANEQK